MSNFSKKIILAALGLSVLTIIKIDTVNAQATLQGAQSSLQQQTGQAQQSVSTQNQTGAVQNPNQGSILDQKTGVNLGVVSNPNQAVPEVTVPPSSKLTTETPRNKESSKKPLVLITGSLLIVAVGLFILRRPAKQLQPDTAIKPEVKPEPLRTPRKHKKSTRRQRKKTSPR